MSDPTRGLYEKFKVSRTDGSSKPGRKHDGCEYFVLDLTHDEFALPSLIAYARACRKKFPLLAKDLDEKTRVIRALRGQFFQGPSPTRQERP